jgi:hypothetical protein
LWQPDPGAEAVSLLRFRPGFFTIADHLVSSRSMSAAYASGVEASGSAPSAAILSFSSSEVTVACSAALSFSTIGRGVPAGATMP